MDVLKNTILIKEETKRLGFDFCGISNACFLEEQAPRLENWLKQKMQGEMHYLEKNFDKRLDPRLLVENAKSVISLLTNYYPEKIQGNLFPQISKYAYGKDYHDVIKGKLGELLHFLKKNIGAVNGRGFVDSAPVMDKVWAAKSGAGWTGKNSNLVTRKGSYFFISDIILDLELIADYPVRDYCGTCTACIDACPTNAIIKPYVVNGSKCISYFTIELKTSSDEEYEQKVKNLTEREKELWRKSGWVFGCDICQDVCPWNRFSKPQQENFFKPVNDQLLSLSEQEWIDLSEAEFGLLCRDSPLKRPKLEGIKRNVGFINKKSR